MGAPGLANTSKTLAPGARSVSFAAMGWAFARGPGKPAT